MAEPIAYDVFLSHSFKDKPIVRPLAERLRKDGLRVWFDEWELKPGDNIPAKIEEGLEQSRVLVLGMSANAFGSEWASLESHTFRFRDPLNKDRRFIPLRLDDAPIIGSLAQFLPIDWNPAKREEVYAKLLGACRPLAKPPTEDRSAARETFGHRVLSLGHTNPVRSVTFSPNNSRALTGSEDKTIRLWDVETGQCLRVFEGHSASVYCVSWSSDARRALSGSEDKTVRLWGVESGRCLRVLEGHSGGVNSVSWSSDARHALSGSEDKTVRLWDVESGRCLLILEGHSGGVNSVLWSSGARSALSGSADKTVRLWDVESGKCLRVLIGHSAGVRSVAWSSDARSALSGSADKTVRLWDVESGKCLRVLNGHSAGVNSVAWSSDGRWVLSGSTDNTVRLWDVESGQCLRVLNGHPANVWCVAWSSGARSALSGSADNTVRLWDVESGQCLRVLNGHSECVISVAWSSDGRWVLSGSTDNTVRLWDVESGQCLRVLNGHSAGVRSVAWSSDARFALSGSYDNTVRLWEVESGQCVRVLKGHSDIVRSVSWSSDGRRALSGSSDNTLRLWEVESGQCLSILKGHSREVNCVSWSSDAHRVLSGSSDNTIRLWEMDTGRCLRVLEGHSDNVLSVSWSSDARCALSGSSDKTVRLWDTESGQCLCVLEGHSDMVQSVAWSSDGRRAFSGAANGVWREWDVSTLITWAPTADAATSPVEATRGDVQYANAKVLLVGDTGVGKSSLAERLVRKEFVPTRSSHARKADVLESTVVTESTGVSLHQETVLWDLAGQPAYRLVHQLSMEDAAIACVLFDCSNEVNPFEGAAYWSQVLDQSRSNTKLIKILVASRIDVGGLPAGQERIDAFLRAHHFSEFIPTSAYSGVGCDALLEAIRRGIRWNELPKVTTTATLAALRDYVARLKGEKHARDDRRSTPVQLLTISALHEGFAAHLGEKMDWGEFLAHMQRLEAIDAVDLLVFHTTGAEPRPETLVLLDPTRVDAYASALLVAAKDEPDGPGHMLEARVRAGDFQLDSDERIPDKEFERHVLWFVMESLLSRDLALHEQIQKQDYIVFPYQCTAELRFPGVASFGVAFGFAGPVRSIYATLIAQLAHYVGFTEREFFLDAATYSAKAGSRCLVRLSDQGRGLGELEVSFEGGTPAPVRQGFLEFVGKHLEAKSNPGSVTRRHAYHCANTDCRNPFEDRVVKARLEAQKKKLICPICEEKTPLVDLLASPTPAADKVAAKIETDARAGRQRMTAALVRKAKEDEGKYDVFLSHNSRDKAAVEKIAKQLLKVGLRPWLDKWDLPPGSTVMDALEKEIKTIPCAAFCFGPADIGKWQVMEIRAYVERWASGEVRMIPVILPEAKEAPELPLFVRQTLWVDMRDWEKPDSDGFYRLVCGILGKAPGDSPLRKFGVRDVAEWQGRR